MASLAGVLGAEVDGEGALSRWVSVGSKVAEVTRGSRQAPPWMYISQSWCCFCF